MATVYSLRIYLLGEADGYKAHDTYATRVTARRAAEAVAREGFWATEQTFMPPSQIRSVQITAKEVE